jgi:hypothetical protein
MDKRLLDSNIIIYAIKPQHAALRNFLRQYDLWASQVSRIEVLGYHLLTPQDKADLEAFFNVVGLLDISQQVIDQAITLRQSRKFSLGDSLIGATAIVHQIPVLTRNVNDFAGVAGLQAIDPFVI